MATDDYTPRFVGDTADPLSAFFTRTDGSAYPIGGATVTMKFRNKSNPSEVITCTGVWTVTNGLNGQASYAWNVLDVAQVGEFDILAETVLQDGTIKHWQVKLLEFLAIW